MPAPYINIYRIQQKEQGQMMRKVENRKEKQDPNSRMKSETHFSLWMIDSDVQDFNVPYIFTQHETRLW